MGWGLSSTIKASDAGTLFTRANAQAHGLEYTDTR